VAILEDDRLVELLVDRPDLPPFGRRHLRRKSRPCSPAFRRLRQHRRRKSAFLHASDLIEAEEDEDPKTVSRKMWTKETATVTETGAVTVVVEVKGRRSAGRANRRGQPRPSRRRPAPNIAAS